MDETADEITSSAHGASSPAKKRSIGFVINRLHGGGAERVVCTLANHYVNEGLAEVHILSLAGQRCFFELSPEVRLESVWDSEKMMGLNGMLRTRSAAARIRDWREKNRLDGVISFLPRANFANVMSYPPSQRRSARVIVSQRNVATHIYPGDTLGGRVGRAVIRRLYNRADSVVCNSPDVALSLTEIGVKSPRQVIGNPQDICTIRAASREPVIEARWKKETLRMIAVGRLIPQKAYDILLPALARLKGKLDFEFRILGQGALKQDLLDQRDALGLSDCVRFLGWLDNPFPLMRQADLFVLPSRWEGFGNVLVEAMALGLPIVAAHCPGSPGWLLEEGRSGILCSPEDPDDLYRALLRAGSDPQLRMELARQARRRAEDFDVAAIARRYMDVMFPDDAERETATATPAGNSGQPKSQSNHQSPEKPA